MLAAAAVLVRKCRRNAGSQSQFGTHSWKLYIAASVGFCVMISSDQKVRQSARRAHDTVSLRYANILMQHWAQNTRRAAAPYKQRIALFWNSDAGLVAGFAAIVLVFPAIAFIALVVYFKGLADFEAGRSTKTAIFEDRWPRIPLATATPQNPAESRYVYFVPSATD